MAFDSQYVPDDTDWRILAELQADGRLSFSELGRRVAMSAPAVTERVRRLEDLGVITGYRAVVDPERVGRPVQAWIRVRFATRDYRRFNEAIAERDDVLQAHHITGDDCYLIHVAVPDMASLERTVGFVADYGTTTTSVIFSSPHPGRGVAPPRDEDADLRAVG